MLHEDLPETDDVAIITIDLDACFGSKLFSVTMFWNECSEDTRSSIIFTPSTVSESRSPNHGSPDEDGGGRRTKADHVRPASSVISHTAIICKYMSNTLNFDMEDQIHWIFRVKTSMSFCSDAKRYMSLSS